MKTIWGAVLLALMLLTASALAADLDTPKVGAAVCAPEEENGSAGCMGGCDQSLSGARRTGGAKR